MGTEAKKKKSEKEACEICGEKISLTQPKIKKGVGDRVICLFCLKDGKATLKCEKCGKEFNPKEKRLEIKPYCPDCLEAENQAKDEANKGNDAGKKGSSAQGSSTSDSSSPNKKGKKGILVGLVLVAVALYFIFGSGSGSIEIEGTPPNVNTKPYTRNQRIPWDLILPSWPIKPPKNRNRLKKSSSR